MGKWSLIKLLWFPSICVKQDSKLQGFNLNKNSDIRWPSEDKATSQRYNWITGTTYCFYSICKQCVQPLWRHRGEYPVCNGGWALVGIRTGRWGTSEIWALPLFLLPPLCTRHVLVFQGTVQEYLYGEWLPLAREPFGSYGNISLKIGKTLQEIQSNKEISITPWWEPFSNIFKWNRIKAL